MSKALQTLWWVGLGVILGLAVFAAVPTAHAYPEYTNRTGQQCTACHVSPAGGGPRTLRGLLWIAAGRPDEVPPLPGGDDGADEVADGPTLFDRFECSRCHGAVGEGGVAAALNAQPWTEAELAQIIRNGIDAMNGYPPAVISDDDLAILIPYVQAMGRGEVQSTVVLYKRPLPPLRLDCALESLSSATSLGCNGN